MLGDTVASRRTEAAEDDGKGLVGTVGSDLVSNEVEQAAHVQLAV